MARRKNTKRIDPRYFLHETVNRDINTGEALEEERQAPVTHWVAGPDGLTDQHGDVFVKHGTAFAATRKPSAGQGMMVIGVGHGTSTERWFGERPVPYEDVQKHRSNPNYNPPEPGPEHRPRRGWNETIDRGEEELEEGWKEFAQGAGDFLDDTLLGKPRGYSKTARQNRARRDADAEALSATVSQRAARKKEKATSDRERAQDREKQRKAQDIRNRQLDKWEAGQKDQRRRAQKKKEDDRRHSGFGSDHYVEQE